MKKQTTPQEKPTLLADVLRFVVGAFFVVMTMAFITVPYALSSIPGAAAGQVLEGRQVA